MLLQGTVLINKNPSMHPGDMQLARAVDNPALRHLYNVLVFPAPMQLPDIENGEEVVGELRPFDQPLCVQMSGSDLDGDLYNVLWDDDIINAVKDRAREELQQKNEHMQTHENGRSSGSQVGVVDEE